MSWTPFAGIRGHAAQIEVLRRMCAAGTPAHAYLFEGPPGVGKQTVARALAARLACLRAQGRDDACGECRSCHALQRGDHPDIAVLARDGTQIKIARVREALRRLRYPAVLGRAKSLLIEDADKLREEAANALLKTLEEPAAATHFVLLSSRPQLLLDTIRSRTRSVRFAGLAPADVQALLVAEGFDAEMARVAGALSQGDLGRARGLCNAELLAAVDTVAGRMLTLDLVDGSTTPDFVDAITARLTALRSEVKRGPARLDRERLAWLLDVIRALLRDAMLVATGIPAADLPHARYEAELAAMAGRVRPEAIAAVLEEIDRIERDLVYNPNPRLTLEAWLATASAMLAR